MRVFAIFIAFILILTPLISIPVIGQTNTFQVNTSGDIAGIAYGNDTVYVISHSGELQAYNRTTEQLKWSKFTIFGQAVEGLHYSRANNQLYALGAYSEFTVKGSVTRWSIVKYTEEGTSSLTQKQNVRYQIAVDQSRILGGTGSGGTSVNLSTYNNELMRLSATTQTYIQSTVAIQTETNTGVVFRNNNTHIYNYSNWNLQRTFTDDGNLNFDLWAVNNESLLTQSGMYNYNTGAQYFSYTGSQAVAIHPIENTGYVLDSGLITAYAQNGDVIDTISISGATSNKNNAHLKTISIDGSTHLLYGYAQYVGIRNAPKTDTQPPSTPTETTIQPTPDSPPISVYISVIVSGCVAIALLLSLYFRSTFGIFGVMLMLVALIGAFITNLPLLWFWITTLLEIFILIIASIAYARAATRTKN